jgi:glycosyltransferase involved in cell wall biosynthesis
MKVLFLCPQPFFQWRGSPIRVGFDLQALAELGHEVDALVMPVGEDRAIPGVRLLRVPNVLGVKNLAIGPSPAKAVLDGVLFFKALRLARKHRYEVVHGVEEAGAIAVVVARLAGGRVIYEKHSDPASYRGGVIKRTVMWLYRKVEHFTIRRADAVIGTGPALTDQARHINPDVPAHHIFDIASSLVEADAEKTARIRRDLERNSSDVLAMYVGSFASYQGIDLMFEALADVVATHPTARFVVIGGTPDEIEQRKAWLAERGAGRAVLFPGKIPPDELPHYLAAADVLLSPRIAGANTPMKLLDYMKAGGAILATDNAANRLILDETCSLLVEARPQAFADGIRRLVGDPGLRERLGTAGRSRASDRYSFAEFKKRLGACYQGLPPGKTAP